MLWFLPESSADKMGKNKSSRFKVKVGQTEEEEAAAH